MAEFVCLIWKVEHGSAAFLRTPNDKTLMLDAGSSEDFSPASHLAYNYNLNSINNRLDELIISHTDSDHIYDLPQVYNLLKPRILSQNKSIPLNVLYPEGAKDLKEPLLTYKEMDETYIHSVSESDKHIPASNWGDVLIQTFHCSPQHIPNCSEDKVKNNLSLLSYIRFNDIEIVFPGDLEPLGWDALIDNTNIKDYVGKSKVRIIVASHHGRKSGIRWNKNNKEEVYDRFLKIMNPHIVIISDRWGNETTDPAAYESFCLGYDVYYYDERKFETAKILTTKTNKCVGMFVIEGTPWVITY